MQTQTNPKLIHLQHFTKPWIRWRKDDTIQISRACSMAHGFLTCHRGTRKSSNLISRKCGITFCPANTIFFSTFPCRDFSIILGELLGTEVGTGKVRMGSKKSEEKSPLDSIENLLCRWTRRTLWILVAIYFSRTQGSLSRLKEMRVSRCFENIYLKVEVLLS